MEIINIKANFKHTQKKKNLIIFSITSQSHDKKKNKQTDKHKQTHTPPKKYSSSLNNFSFNTK